MQQTTRGRRLHSQLNALSSVSEQKEPKKSKGRNPLLIEVRNKQLAYRYYYYSHIKKLRYDAVLEILQTEFWIETATISSIITQKADTLKELFQTKPDISELSKACPRFPWR